jgi:hypothetical protein
MIYDRVRAGRMLKVVLEVTAGALDLASGPTGSPSLRLPAIEAEKAMRAFAAKGDGDAMCHHYLTLLQTTTAMGEALHRHHRMSFESEFYRFLCLYWERE